ncbi:32957_t:CDS:2 [Racocetra persica]|uniref:32957_t:CDS:1 n=1 Tax=Racocetra persica TaxID=160502 RepID=A0ACA9L8P7_9GLOM|nr:32957_t:CDS:2 [Racocetra persica]
MALNKSLKTGHLYSGSDGDNSINENNDNMDIDEINTSKSTIEDSKMKFSAIIRKVVDNDVKRAETSLKALCDVMPPQLRLIMNGSSINEVFGNVNMKIQLSNEHKERKMNDSYSFVPPPSTIANETNTNKEINYTRESNDLWHNNINHLDNRGNNDQVNNDQINHDQINNDQINNDQVNNDQVNNDQVQIDEKEIDKQEELSTKSVHRNDHIQSEQNKPIEPTNHENSSTTVFSNKRKSTQPRKFIIEHHETESRIIRKRARPNIKKRKDIISSDESENMQTYSVDDRDQISQHNTEESSDDEPITSYKHIKLSTTPSIIENQDSSKPKGRYSTRKLANPIVKKGKNSIDSINSDQINLLQNGLSKPSMKAARKFAAPVPKPAPAKPQRPLGSFGYFRKEMFDNRDSMLIGLPWRECIKIVAQRWNSLSEEDKEPYNELQRVASKRFKVENRVYLDYLKENGLEEEKKCKISEKNTSRHTNESKKRNIIDGSEDRKPRKVSNNSLNKPSPISKSRTTASKNTIRAGAASHPRKSGVTKIFIPFVRKD